MASEAELLALAERVEAASGADRDIDGWIHVLTNPDETIVVDEPGRFPRKAIIGPISVIMDRIGGKDGADYLCAPAFTASLDAAMKLVPEGLWAEGSLSSPGQLEVHGPCTFDPIGKGWAATPALALTAACLRARAATMGGSDD